jgi:hypothetical protein
MTENPHENEDLDEKREKSSDKLEKPNETGAWSEDQKRRGYYYDDDCGYEIYDPAADAETEEN